MEQAIYVNMLIITTFRCNEYLSFCTTAGKYRGQPLKAGATAQPKCCSACFVPLIRRLRY